jgi:Tfp pilus assembly protein PilW
MMMKSRNIGTSKCQNNRRYSLRRRWAFTLIELVISIAIGTIICGAAGSLIWNATTIRSEASNRGEMVNAASSALELMLRYCREIKQDECPSNTTPCNLGNAQVSTATATQIRFGTYGFRLTSTNLEMTTDNAVTWYVAAKYVSSLAFAYYNPSGTGLTSFPLSASDREDIRRIVITVNMTRGSQTVKVRCGLYLRSFMNEVMNP